jgi:hypothetical protein
MSWLLWVGIAIWALWIVREAFLKRPD